MPRLTLAICTLAFIASLSISMQVSSAQSEKGSLTGAISDPNGAAVDGAPIQAKNKATGAVARVSSKSDGRYALALVPGDYEFSIVMPCCAYKSVSRNVVLESGKTARLDIQLAETVNGTTLGDDPGRLANVMRKRAKIPSRPVPRLAGGQPDLSGVWVAIDDPYPEEPQVLPWAAALIEERQENHGKDAPHNHCLPGPPPVPGSSAPFIEKFVETGSLLVILFEDNPGFRQVFLDGRAHPSNWDPTWMGHSIGKWDGDTLVLDTVGFNDRSWLGGLGGGNVPHTEMLHMTERYRRVDFGHMDAAVTFEDPGTFVKPFHMNVKLDLAPRRN